MKNKHAEKRFISVQTDYGFKLAFGNEKNTLFLKKALQALIQSKIPIKKISFTNIEIKRITEESRGGLIDISCEDEAGNQFIVEMQRYQFETFLHRLKFYAFHKFNIMVQKGEYRFENFKKIFAIVIVSEEMFPDYKGFHHIAQLFNQNHELIDDQISYIVVELGKFNKQLSELKTDLDKLLYFMKTSSQLTMSDRLPEYFSEDWLKSTIKKLELSKLSKEERMAYEIELAQIGSHVGELELRERRGVKKTKEHFILYFLKEDKQTIDQIVEIAQTTKEEVLRIKKKHKV